MPGFYGKRIADTLVTFDKVIFFNKADSGLEDITLTAASPSSPFGLKIADDALEFVRNGEQVVSLQHKTYDLNQDILPPNSYISKLIFDQHGHVVGCTVSQLPDIDALEARISQLEKQINQINN